jgi:hypothetical protein
MQKRDVKKKLDISIEIKMFLIQIGRKVSQKYNFYKYLNEIIHFYFFNRRYFSSSLLLRRPLQHGQKVQPFPATGGTPGIIAYIWAAQQYIINLKN